MANFITGKVEGAEEFRQAMRDFMSAKQMGQAVRTSLTAAARVTRTAGARNAKALGLGFIGFMKDAKGREYIRRGRIPLSLKVNKPYIPAGSNGDTTRVTIIARTQRVKGIYRNRAPHAHLIEYGHRQEGTGRQVPGRPFLNPALTATATQAVEKFRTTMSKSIDRMKLKGAPR